MDLQTSKSMEIQPVAGEAAVLARRYAKALYELADDNKQLDAVAHDLRSLSQLLTDVPELGQLTRNPLIARRDAEAAMQKLATEAKFTTLVGNFLMLVAKNRRLNQLKHIITAFLANLAAKRGEHTAEVFTAQPLSVGQLSTLESQLQAMTGGHIHLIVKQDNSLLGGLIIKMGSHLIDASVKGKLARIERHLTLVSAQQEAA